MLLYLPALTVLDLAQYYSLEPRGWDYRFMPLTWFCYTVPFVLVCLMRRRKARVWKLAWAPVVASLFVGALWLRASIVISNGGRDPMMIEPFIPWRSPLEGKPAPDLALTTLAGAKFRLSDERGHVVLINFWGIACPPCVAELNLFISSLADDAFLHDRGLRVWTVDVMDDTVAIHNFMAANHYHFTVLSNGTITNAYPGGGIPTTYVIGRDGTVRKVFSGYVPEQLRGGDRGGVEVIVRRRSNQGWGRDFL